MSDTALPLDRIDRALLSALEGDARLSFASLAETVGISKSPCWKRVQALEEANVIVGYHAAIDPGAVGLGTTAFVRLTVRFDEHQAFEAAVQAHPMVMACHATIGDFDYLLQVLARDLPDLDQLLRAELWRLPGVEKFVTTLSIREIKRSAPVTANAWRAAPIPSASPTRRPS
jgi:Lrp/AsnC family leucine-responsive transcriptional regulator